jgi:Cu/Ag efflux protein CusF
MNIAKPLIVFFLFSSAALTSAPGVAQTHMDHSKMDMSKDLTDGEVRKVDKDAGKVTIKHGEIKNLEMPPMTMVFSVREKAMLAKVQPGDKIKFKVINESGKTIVTEIHPGK